MLLIWRRIPEKYLIQVNEIGQTEPSEAVYGCGSKKNTSPRDRDFERAASLRQLIMLNNALSMRNRNKGSLNRVAVLTAGGLCVCWTNSNVPEQESAVGISYQSQ